MYFIILSGSVYLIVSILIRFGFVPALRNFRSAGRIGFGVSLKKWYLILIEIGILFMSIQIQNALSLIQQDSSAIMEILTSTRGI